MKRIKSKKIGLFMGGLLLVLTSALILYILVSVYRRTSNSKEFVDYILSHADTASTDFQECGIVFSSTEEAPDILIVTLLDGRCFYYQTLAEHDDQLVKIECSVEKLRGEDMLTGSLEMKRWGRNEVNVMVRCDDEAYKEIRVLNYYVPEFDKYEFTFKSADTALRISQWISKEELSLLYKEGKELEEVLSEYCKLKSYNVGVNIYNYQSLYEETIP